MSTRSRTGALLWRAAIIALSFTLSGCDEDVELTDDPTLDLWCGKKLCSSWSTTGEIERVGTWNEADFGVALQTKNASLSQKITRYSEALSCVRMSVLGNWDDSSRLMLDLDFDDDGMVDSSMKLPARHWERWSGTIYGQSAVHTLRITLRREGAHGVQLAEIRARKDYDGCVEDDLPASFGDECVVDDDCEMGRCHTQFLSDHGTCGECLTDADCHSGTTCNEDVDYDDDDGANDTASSSTRRTGFVCN